MKGSGAEINLISTDLNTCKKSTTPTHAKSPQHQHNRTCIQAKSEFLKAKTQTPSQDATIDKSPSAPGRQICGVLLRKNEKIRSTFPISQKLQHIAPESPPPVPSTFSTVTEDQVTKIIMKSPSKSCSLDPWPTFLVFDYLDILITPTTSIINASLKQGKCPNFFKQAHVTPILKKSSLDKEILKNYRPVSNLNFISKILEKVVAVQLQTHLDEAGLMTAFQSAYRKHHSTESALLNIHNNSLLNMAKGSVTALTLLDLSATFDTIDHTILLDRLNVHYGISELALGWFIPVRKDTLGQGR